MKIVRLEAENVKRIVAVQISPDGNVVIVGGKNGAGKSSVLDSIMYALGGKAAIPSKPIRRGEDHASVTVELDGFVVVRTWTEKGTYLTVKTKDGATYSSGQKMLDELVGRLSFDPLAFTGMKPADQAATLRDLVGIDHAALDEERARVYAERTDVNRESKRLAGAVSSAEYHEDAPDVEVSVAGLMDELREAERHNQSIVDANDALNLMRDQREKVDARISELQAEIEKLADERSTLDRQIKSAEVNIEKAKPVDADAIRDQIASADATNRKVRDNAERRLLLTKQNEAEAESAKLTEQIEAIDKRKRDELAAAKFPLDGLGFDADGVTLDGLPFDQASQAEQLRAATAIGLAMNPKLRVVLIREASRLDSDALKLMAELAAEHDAQLWMERVGDGDECSVVIEDGAVREPATANA